MMYLITYTSSEQLKTMEAAHTRTGKYSGKSRSSGKFLVWVASGHPARVPG